MAIVGSGKLNETRRLLSQIGLQYGPLRDYAFVHKSEPGAAVDRIMKTGVGQETIITLSTPIADLLSRQGYEVERIFGAERKLSAKTLKQAIWRRDVGPEKEIQKTDCVFFASPPQRGRVHAKHAFWFFELTGEIPKGSIGKTAICLQFLLHTQYRKSTAPR